MFDDLYVTINPGSLPSRRTITLGMDGRASTFEMFYPFEQVDNPRFNREYVLNIVARVAYLRPNSTTAARLYYLGVDPELLYNEFADLG